MPEWITVYRPANGQWAVIRSSHYPAYHSAGWRLWPKAESDNA